MTTPYAILIGLALIAVAIFYREPPIKSARAGLGGSADALVCLGSKMSMTECFVLHRDNLTRKEFVNGKWIDSESVKFG